MDPSLIAIFTAAGIASFFLGRYAISADSKLEDLRRRAITLSGWCQAQGFHQLAALLVSFSVGDYSELISGVRTTMDILADSDNANATLDVILDKQLARKLSTVEGREQVLAKLETMLNVKIDREAMTQEPTSLKKEQ